MGVPVLILGESGSGKSCSLRNLDPNTTAIFNVAGKPLPFRAKFPYVLQNATYPKIISSLRKGQFKRYN